MSFWNGDMSEVDESGGFKMRYFISMYISDYISMHTMIYLITSSWMFWAFYKTVTLVTTVL